MKVVAIQGFSKSGKTTVTEALISSLRRRGHSVGSVKEIHFDAFAIDTPGSNTDRHKQAGSSQTTALGKAETDILFPRKLALRELLGHYDQDFVVLEGVDDACIPTIITASTLEDIAQKDNGAVFLISGRLAEQHALVEGIEAIDVLTEPEKLTDAVVKNALPLLPALTYEECGLCGTGCKEFCQAHIEGFDTPKPCPLTTMPTTLKVGSTQIVLTEEENQQIQSMFAEVVSNREIDPIGESITFVSPIQTNDPSGSEK